MRDDEEADLASRTRFSELADGINMDDVRYGFLSTLDHLPCDVVRTLWTIQSLDLGTIGDEHRDEEMLRQAQHLLELVRQERKKVAFEKQELERFKEIQARYDGYVKKQPKLKSLSHQPLKIKISLKSKREKQEQAQLQSQAQAQAQSQVQPQDKTADAELYCFCRDVSYGPMIACDNETCPIEWFHYACVGLTSAPKANEKWFCSDKCRQQYYKRHPDQKQPGSSKQKLKRNKKS